MTPRTAAAEAEPRRHGVLGALAAALPDRGGRRVHDRPDLRVVEPAGRRRRRSWQVGTLAGGMLFAALFAIAGAHTLIVQQQRHLDDVNGRIAVAEEQGARLRTDLAELQSPERILREAKERLGMVEAPAPVYLQPRIDDDTRAAEVPASTPPTTVAKATTPATTASATSSSGTTRTAAAPGRATTPTTAGAGR